MYKGYKYRLYPTTTQKEQLEKNFGCCRFIYNWGLQRKIEEYQKTGKSPSAYDLSRELTLLRKDARTLWLKEATSDSLQHSLINLDQAFVRFFREKQGFPKFKKKGLSKNAIHCSQGFKIDWEKGRFTSSKIKNIVAKFHQQFEGNLRSASIYKTPSMRYFVSIIVETPDPVPPKPKIEPSTSIGLDLGLTHFCTLSTGEKVENPKHLKKNLQRIKFQQRRLSRKQKGSNRQRKQRVKVAKLHETVANRRTDFLHKLSYRLTHENQVNTICVEDLAVRNMQQNRCLAQGISDVSWSKFIEYLQYKCEWYGKNLVKIGRFEPSSKMCTCGRVNSKLTIDQRSWKCVYCNVTHDRDVLAANNIKRFALQKTNLLGQASQELFVRSAGPEFTLGERKVLETTQRTENS